MAGANRHFIPGGIRQRLWTEGLSMVPPKHWRVSIENSGHKNQGRPCACPYGVVNP
ncbi:hypothetical protein SAMN05660860_03486 [Geoalkalibacter ferrihydriticus]|uniref:Uncharacterized protein n=1 Tax=Geoalkalibacter ferrihydriticus TaxID=392333 RepID=A0A1G9XKI7_9BACT|nr:hypothetical protein SAMN05660860_03486 [Geoalkalibacter ferrihydriticus]